MEITNQSLKACIDNEIAICSICLQTLRSPRSLPCLHTFCLSCIQTYCQTRSCGRIPCPQCRSEFTLPQDGASSLPRNFVMENLMQMSRRHNYEFCEEHDEEIIKKFCTECCVQICSVCQVLHHSNHDCIKRADAREHLIKRVDEEVAKVAAAAKHLTEEKKRLEDMTDMFLDQSEKVIEDIKSTGTVMKQLIDKHVSALISNVREIETTTLDKLKSMMRPVSEAFQILKQLNFDAKYIKIDEDYVKYLVRDFQNVCKYAKQFLECEGTNLSPSSYKPPEISFEPNNDNVSIITDLSLGAIIVPIKERTLKRKHTMGNPEEVIKAKKASVSHLVHELELNDGDEIHGMAILCKELYILHLNSVHDIEVYDSTNYTLLRGLDVPECDSLDDMISCEHNQCLYISEAKRQRVHRVEVNGHSTKWNVGDKPSGLSVTANHNILVTCSSSKKLKEFTSHGHLVNETNLPESMVCAWHAIKLSSGQFAVCHGNASDLVQQVCIVDSNGNITHSYGDVHGSDMPDLLRLPHHSLATDEDGYIFVMDRNDRRILLLSPELQFVGDVATPDQFEDGGPIGRPWSMCYDVRWRRLHVAEKITCGPAIFGRILLLNV